RKARYAFYKALRWRLIVDPRHPPGFGSGIARPVPPRAAFRQLTRQQRDQRSCAGTEIQIQGFAAQLVHGPPLGERDLVKHYVDDARTALDALGRIDRQCQLVAVAFGSLAPRE